MLEAYSINLSADAESAVPLNNIAIDKGCTAKLVAPATIQLNKAGIYMVSCDASFIPTAAGTVGVQLRKNGQPLPQAQSTETGAEDTISSLSFYTLVQVSQNNNQCCNTNPTLLQVVNLSAGTFNNINVCVTKIC